MPVAKLLVIANPKTRQTVGWVAGITVFNAVVVWSYVLLKGPADPGVPMGPQPTLQGMQEHPESKRLREKAAHDASAAEAAKASGGQDDGHGGGAAKKDDGHGGGH